MYKKYKVIDSTNHLVKCFSSYREAFSFLIMNQRYDWKIIN